LFSSVIFCESSVTGTVPLEMAVINSVRQAFPRESIPPDEKYEAPASENGLLQRYNAEPSMPE